MSLLSNLLLVVSLAALSLAACAGENQCQSEECLVEEGADTETDSALDLIRVDIEVVGEGAVVVEDDEAVRCTSVQGLCSFSYVRGTDLTLYAEDSSTDGALAQDGCGGAIPCYIHLDFDQVVVANFQDEGGRSPSGLTIIVDPVPGWYRGDTQQTIVPATIASAE